MIGSHATEWWARQGHHVTALDNLRRSKLFGSARESVEYQRESAQSHPRASASHIVS